jgi:hypothetical protein
MADTCCSVDVSRNVSLGGSSLVSLMSSDDSFSRDFVVSVSLMRCGSSFLKGLFGDLFSSRCTQRILRSCGLGLFCKTQVCLSFHSCLNTSCVFDLTCFFVIFKRFLGSLSESFKMGRLSVELLFKFLMSSIGFCSRCSSLVIVLVSFLGKCMHGFVMSSSSISASSGSHSYSDSVC